MNLIYEWLLNFFHFSLGEEPFHREISGWLLCRLCDYKLVLLLWQLPNRKFNCTLLQPLSSFFICLRTLRGTETSVSYSGIVTKSVFGFLAVIRLPERNADGGWRDRTIEKFSAILTELLVIVCPASSRNLFASIGTLCSNVYSGMKDLAGKDLIHNYYQQGDLLMWEICSNVYSGVKDLAGKDLSHSYYQQGDLLMWERAVFTFHI